VKTLLKTDFRGRILTCIPEGLLVVHTFKNLVKKILFIGERE